MQGSPTVQQQSHLTRRRHSTSILPRPPPQVHISINYHFGKKKYIYSFMSCSKLKLKFSVRSFQFFPNVSCMAFSFFIIHSSQTHTHPHIIIMYQKHLFITRPFIFLRIVLFFFSSPCHICWSFFVLVQFIILAMEHFLQTLFSFCRLSINYSLSLSIYVFSCLLLYIVLRLGFACIFFLFLHVHGKY